MTLKTLAAPFIALVALFILGFLITALYTPQTQIKQVAQGALLECGELPRAQKEGCYSEYFMGVAAAEDAVFAFRALNELQKKDPDAIGCHFIGHGIGYGVYSKNPEAWEESFRTISQECTYGAMHGILELAISDLPNGLTREFTPEICGENPRGDCNHIVGHLTLIETAGDIPSALTYCNVLEGELQQEFCESGVFMEHMTAFNLISHGLADESYLNWAARVDEVVHLCNTFTGRSNTQCWKELAHMLVVKEEAQPERVFNFCNTAPTQAARFECRSHSIGILAAGLNFDYAHTPSICAASQPEEWFAEHCYSNVVSSALSTIPENTDGAIAYCEGLESRYQHACFATIGNVITFNAFYDFDDPKELCKNAPSMHRQACMQGGAVNYRPYEYHPEII